MPHTPKEGPRYSTLATLKLGTLGHSPCCLLTEVGPSLKSVVSEGPDPLIRELNIGLLGRGSNSRGGSLSRRMWAPTCQGS